MKTRYSKIKCFSVMAVVIILLVRCGEDPPTVPPLVHNYKVNLSGPGSTLAGLCFGLSDPTGVIDSMDIQLSIPNDSRSVVHFSKNDSTSSWQFMILMKHGTLDSEEIAQITTVEELSAFVEIREVCDTLGNLLAPTDYQITVQH